MFVRLTLFVVTLSSLIAEANPCSKGTPDLSNLNCAACSIGKITGDEDVLGVVPSQLWLFTIGTATRLMDQNNPRVRSDGGGDSLYHKHAIRKLQNLGFCTDRRVVKGKNSSGEDVARVKTERAFKDLNNVDMGLVGGFITWNSKASEKDVAKTLGFASPAAMKAFAEAIANDKTPGQQRALLKEFISKGSEAFADNERGQALKACMEQTAIWQDSDYVRDPEENAAFCSLMAEECGVSDTAFCTEGFTKKGPSHKEIPLRRNSGSGRQ
ncbi:MAG: hypothetical protein N2578_01260 [Bdellovibrionaceae bacterium]|nr:hypothetical protein [Pseudobdellovibrionaceae bacterium]